MGGGCLCNEAVLHGKLIAIKTWCSRETLDPTVGSDGEQQKEPAVGASNVRLCAVGEEGLDPVMCHSSNWQTISRNPATQHAAMLSGTRGRDSRGGRREEGRGGAVFRRLMRIYMFSLTGLEQPSQLISGSFSR